MKTNFLLLFIALCLSAFSQPIKISGTLINLDKTETVYLTNIAQKDAPIKINKNGSFSVTINLKSGCYQLTEVGNVYLEPGYDLNITPNKDSNYVFNGKGSVENNLMLEAKKLINNYFSMGENGFLFSTYLIEPDTFLIKLELYKTQAHHLLDESTSDNFKTIAKGDIDSYCRNLLGNYFVYYGYDSAIEEHNNKIMMDSAGKIPINRLMAMQREVHIKSLEPEQMLKLYKMTYNSLEMNDSLLFINSDEYRKNVSTNIEAALMTNFMSDFIERIPQPIIKLKVVNKFITNPFIHEYYAYTLTNEIIKTPRDSSFKDSVYSAYMSHSTNVVYREKISQYYNNTIAFANNKMAPDFNYPNVDGKNISLKSLKGKYVYIDVWATWCEPCKKEIPFLSAIETEYENKNIQFISVSVDFPKDKNKWLNYVKAKKLKGIQLMADDAFDSDFIKKFNINAIPRFILIDPNGKIIAADALRPSDEKLRKTLDSLL